MKLLKPLTLFVLASAFWLAGSSFLPAQGDPPSVGQFIPGGRDVLFFD